MAAANRATILTKSHKVLKKHYKAASPPSNRSVLDHMLVAACLENSDPESAEKCLELLKEKFFDFNEVRVSAVRELAEVMRRLPDADAAARRVKGILQSVFEAQYSFDLEGLKKQNIGAAVKQLEKYDGATPFVVSYTTQNALGGHSIPLNQGAMLALRVLDVVSESEAAKYKVPGLERAIPKNKGVEYGSLLGQFGAQVLANPYSTNVKKILLEIDPDCKPRLPKKAPKKKAATEEAPTSTAKSKKKTPAKKAPAKKKPTSKKATTKKATKKTAAKKKPTTKKTASKKKPTTKKTTKKSATKRLARRKPR